MVQAAAMLVTTLKEAGLIKPTQIGEAAREVSRSNQINKTAHHQIQPGVRA
jgi:hypothetical protein